jgi:signal transduction histidine kinase
MKSNWPNNLLMFAATWLTLLPSLGQVPVTDTTAARAALDGAKQNLSNLKTADSLALRAFELSGNNHGIRAESAYVICFANAPINFGRAQQWGDSAMVYYKKLNNTLWQGYTLRMLGVRAQALSKNELAIDYFQKSTPFFEACFDTVMVAQNYINLSLLYHNNIADFVNGLKYAKKGLALIESQHANQPVLHWRAINAVAINHDDAGRWDEAIAFHRRNLTTKDPAYLGNTLNNLGNTLRKKGEFVQAESYFRQCLRLLDPKNLYMLATVYLNLSQVNEDLGRRAKALQYNDSSLHYALKTKDVEKLRDSYDVAYHLYQKEGNYRKAFDALNHFMEIKDSVLNKDKAAVIYEMESRYQASQKEQQIARLQNETLNKNLEIQQSRFITWVIVVGVFLLGMATAWYNKRLQYRLKVERSQEREDLQRQRFSAVIEAEENERSRVAKDLHDGLGQLISTAKLGLSAVSIPSHDPQHLLLYNSINVLDRATQEVRSIAHNLMPAALTELGLRSALEDMVDKINGAKLMNVQLNMTGIDQRLPGTVEVAVYRVIQEVINNMLKHSRADQIQVNLTRIGNALNLSIADNGVGFEKELITRSKGLGWKSVFSRIALLNGNIEVDTRPGAGTSVSIQFAIA